MNDGVVLFDATHKNIVAGALPSETSLSDMRLAMRDQVTLGGGLLSTVPKYLVVPSELETLGEKLITTVQATMTTNVNPFAFLELIVEPRLTNPQRWYLTADPTLIDGLEYAYLAGAPGIQTSSEVGFMTDGVSIKARLDYGCGFVEHRGWVTNAGV